MTQMLFSELQKGDMFIKNGIRYHKRTTLTAWARIPHTARGRRFLVQQIFYFKQKDLVHFAPDW